MRWQQKLKKAKWTLIKGATCKFSGNFQDVSCCNHYRQVRTFDLCQAKKKMASSQSLQRGLNLARAHRSVFLSTTRYFSSASDALVEVKPGEVGTISGVPEKHLRRRVRSSLFLSPLCLSHHSVSCFFIISLSFRLIAEKNVGLREN